MESYVIRAPCWSTMFLLRAGSDCLPIPMNLHRWRYRVSNSCLLCCSTNPTTAHILNVYSEALNQGRYTWRHDLVLSCLISHSLHKLDPSIKIFADHPRRCASDFSPFTIPTYISTHISTTTSKPDLHGTCLRKNITLLELTIPSNTPAALAAARARKSLKPNYLQLIIDLVSQSL